MDIKLKTSQMLLRKLAAGSGDAQLNAVAEIRLFSKWDDANRFSLAKAGAIASLLKILEDMHVDARVKENAMSALLNMSINPAVKMRMAHEPWGLDVVMRLARDGGTNELKVSAAALLYSLLIDDGARKNVCSSEMLGETLVGLLKDGSAKCKAEALKALFVLAKDEEQRDNLLQEKYRLIGLLVSLLTVGKVKLTEDCLAVLALLASCPAGAKALMQDTSVVAILVYLVNSGSPRAQENATAVLLSMCRYDEGAKEAMPRQTLLPALHNLEMGESERGKSKAEALLKLLGFDMYSSIAEDPNLSVQMGDSTLSFGSSYGRGTMSGPLPFMPANPPHINYSPPHHQAKLQNHVMEASSPSPSSPAKTNKYITFARKLFTNKARKKSYSSIN